MAVHSNGKATTRGAVAMRRKAKNRQGNDGQGYGGTGRCKGKAKNSNAKAKQGVEKHWQGFELHSNGEEMNGSDMLRKSAGTSRGDRLRQKI